MGSTVRTYFRQLRAEQWAVDCDFIAEFDRMWSPTLDDVVVTACHPRHQHSADVVQKLLPFLLPTFVGELRVAPFHRLYHAVCYGETLVSPIVAPDENVFARRSGRFSQLLHGILDDSEPITYRPGGYLGIPRG